MIKQLLPGKRAGSILQRDGRYRIVWLTPNLRSQCAGVTLETRRAGGGFLQCRTSLVASTFEVSLHKFPAKPSFDTQVAVANIVFERRGRLHNEIVLDVER